MIMLTSLVVVGVKHCSVFSKSEGKSFREIIVISHSHDKTRSNASNLICEVF